MGYIPVGQPAVIFGGSWLRGESQAAFSERCQAELMRVNGDKDLHYKALVYFKNRKDYRNRPGTYSRVRYTGDVTIVQALRHV